MEGFGLTADSLKKEGNSAFASLQFKRAAKLYRDAIKLDGSNPVLFANRAQCFLKLADYSRANTDCDSGLALDSPSSLKVKLLFRKGLALKGLQDYEQARAYFQHVLSLDPENTAAGMETKSLDSQRRKPKSLRTVRIDVKVVNTVPPEFFEESTRISETDLKIESSDHVTPLASPPPAKPGAESIPNSEDLRESTPFGLRLSMSMLAALKNIPESKKHAAFRYVLSISGEDLTALFGPRTGGVEPEFLEFFMEAAAYVSSETGHQDWINLVYNSLYLLTTFPRFKLSLALCDSHPIAVLKTNVALGFPNYVERYEKIWS